MRYLFKATILFLFSFQILYAQEGGPPMLTDDARVADWKEWEINTSVNTSFAGNWVLSVPHIDLNYGLTPDLQFKIEAPLLFDILPGQKTQVGVGQVIAGLKYRFLEEEKHYVSAATFPQYSFNGIQGLYVPLFIEKTFGKFHGGIALAHFFESEKENHSEIGGLIGYLPKENINLMLEYYNFKHYFGLKGNHGYLNAGFRYIITENFYLMGSLGTQIHTPTHYLRESFISWLGIKNLF